MRYTVLLVLFLTGCAGATGAAGLNSSNAVERGLSYVAAAIVTHGVLQILFRR